ncbi:hypothetical protein BHE74_00050780 [Ensete ventricosum]|uniref:Uncharacterized protein n=1 Tax=Ensete ventricosum TaxID=4639 RepID=A0A444FE80_ENSVE|nr:hypothetical protein GW17_00014911 [Ensete ventricosum]RWW43534.1 hypothetical protein BHE74_00050780 [Ensete ventricosum]RZR74755.1 hypothetical protein BHM03_00042526 [Ensete ventricosum]
MYRYIDHPLLDGTAKIDRRWSIEGEIDRRQSIEEKSTVAGRLREKKGRGKEESRKKKIRKNTSRRPRLRVVAARASSPLARRHRPRPWVAREPSPPLLAIFLPHWEKD